MKTIKRWVVTYINSHGLRQLLGPNQGRFFKATKAEADILGSAIVLNNRQNRLSQVYGPQSIGTFESREVECYENGDAIGIYFDL